MRYKLVDVLACPECKNFPLELHVIEASKNHNEVSNIKNELQSNTKPECELFCSYLNKYTKSLTSAPCAECNMIDIKKGYLVCDKCNRWYPILDGIPELLPDYLRDDRREHEISISLGIKARGTFIER